jgi:RNA polymerase sigma-70 factor (ECF subfamily)
MEERTLIEKAKHGDRDAFCSLYGRYKDRLYRYAYYRLGNHQDAEDAVSECVLSAWKQIPGLRQPGAFGGWIFRILSGCCAGYIKTQIRRKGELDLETADAKDQRSSQIDDIILREALSRLSEEERNIVLLSVVSGLTSKEISEVTELTPGAVRSKLSRSLGKLRGYLS